LIKIKEVFAHFIIKQYLETFFNFYVPVFIVANQALTQKRQKITNGNVGNKKCFHSFVLDLLKKLQNGTKRQDIAGSRRAVF
jgi:hypothetical protein